MDLNFRKIFNVIGFLLILQSGLFLLPILTGLYYGEMQHCLAFAETALGCMGAGAALYVMIKPQSDTLKIRDGFFIASLSWILLSLIGALPFWLDGCIPSFTDAFFETSSGLTTTGSTILPDVTALPRCMLFWRSFTHWIGGMGILVLTVAMLPSLGNAGQTIVRYESPGPTLTKMAPKTSDTSKLLYLIYGGMTVAETVLLKLGGMSFFDAMLHTFGTVGTGGFSDYNDSIAHFASPYLQMVISVFMILAGINFALYFLLITGRYREVAIDSELRLYLLIIGITSMLITIALYLSHTYNSFLTAFRYALFQVASIITTTGYATADYDAWPSVCRMLILMLFFIGGCSSSTAGGIKVIRVFVLLKLIKRAVAVRLHPNAMYNIKANRQVIPRNIIDNICSFAFLYFLTLFAVMFLVSFDGKSFMTCFSAAATCLGNVGPGFDAVGPTTTFHAFSAPIKVILSLTMIAGRLELYSFFLIFTPGFWDSKR